MICPNCKLVLPDHKDDCPNNTPSAAAVAALMEKCEDEMAFYEGMAAYA